MTRPVDPVLVAGQHGSAVEGFPALRPNEGALRCASLPVLDDRQPDEILGYDEAGAPC